MTTRRLILPLTESEWATLCAAAFHTGMSDNGDPDICRYALAVLRRVSKDDAERYGDDTSELTPPAPHGEAQEGGPPPPF